MMALPRLFSHRRDPVLFAGLMVLQETRHTRTHNYRTMAVVFLYRALINASNLERVATAQPVSRSYGHTGQWITVHTGHLTTVLLYYSYTSLEHYAGRGRGCRPWRSKWTPSSRRRKEKHRCASRRGRGLSRRHMFFSSRISGCPAKIRNREFPDNRNSFHCFNENAALTKQRWRRKFGGLKTGQGTIAP